MISIILINGPSGCGKTSLATAISSHIKTLFITKSPHSPSSSPSSLLSGVSLESPPQQQHTTHQQKEPNHTHQGGDKDGNEIPVISRIFHQDQYFIKPFLPYNKRTDDSYENDSGISWDKLTQDILNACLENENGYNCSGSHSCSRNVIIIVEGHVLSSQIISNHLDTFDNILFVSMRANKETCKYRRLNRNIHRSEKEYQELSDYYERFVWPSYLKYGYDAIGSFQKLLKKKDDGTELNCHTVNSSCSSSNTTVVCRSTNRRGKMDTIELCNEHDDKDLKKCMHVIISFLMKQKWIS